MKKITRLTGGGATLLAALFLFVMCVNNAHAQTQDTVSITNSYSESISLTINASDGNHPMTVGANSNQQQIVPVLISITINGQTVPLGSNAQVTLPDSTVVNVNWPSGGGSGMIPFIITGAGG